LRDGQFNRRDVNVMGRKTEKTAGRSGAISCRRAREYFYGFAGCALNSEDGHNLSHHEESCPACGPEFKEWRRLRSALQSNGENAAADFKAGVMGRIRETRQEPATKRSVVWGVVWQHGWARGLAVAAVILIMLSGAAKLPAGESLIAHLTRQVYIAFNTQPATSPTQPVTPAASQQPGTTSSGSAIHPTRTNTPVTSTSNNGVPKTQPVQPQAQPKTGGNNGTQVAVKVPGSPGSGGFTVSNKPLVITTTTLKLAVNDLTQANSTALSIAANYGAGLTSEESAQNGQSNLLFLNFTVDPSMVSVFLDRLNSLGSVVSEEKTNDDVTGNYNSTLEAYNALLAQQQSATDNSGQYTSQINSLEYELQNWSDASGKQVVLLWLMQ
jgi:hypothetical protein